MIPVVHAQGIVYRIGSAMAIDSVDLTVSQGEHIGLGGPNGSGRTTLLQLLATLRAPQAGTLQIAGVDARRFPFDARANVMYVSRDLPAATDLRVREYLDFVRDARGKQSSSRGVTPAHAIERSQLDPHASITRLSPGLRTQLAITAALMVAPALLLLDDPFASLDEAARTRLLAWLGEVRAGGTTVVSAVNANADAAVCTTTLRMERGRIASIATSIRVERNRVGAALTEGV